MASFELNMEVESIDRMAMNHEEAGNMRRYKQAGFSVIAVCHFAATTPKHQMRFIDFAVTSLWLVLKITT